MQIFILPLTNAIKALKYEFLVDPGIIRPEFADSFLSRALPMSLFQSSVALNSFKKIYFKLNCWCHKQEFLISWTLI